MGNIIDRNAETLIREAQQFKDQSLSDPNGVLYMDHLWGMVDNEEYLSLAMRTDDLYYEGYPIRAFWNHGRHDWQPGEKPENSSLVFEIPDELTRRIQSQHAHSSMQKFFGQDPMHKSMNLPMLGKDSNETRTFDQGFSEDTKREIIVDDWHMLKNAIEQTAKDRQHRLGGQTIQTIGTTGLNSALARVNNGPELRILEIYIPGDTVTGINRLWAQAFRKEVLLETPGARERT